VHAGVADRTRERARPRSRSAPARSEFRGSGASHSNRLTTVAAPYELDTDKSIPLTSEPTTRVDHAD
jgi:hypothetical protein